MSMNSEEHHEESTAENQSTSVTQESNEAVENASAEDPEGLVTRTFNDAIENASADAIDVLSSGNSSDQALKQRPESIVSLPVNAAEYSPKNSEGNPSFIVTGFASKHELAHWFPQIEDDENKSWRIWLSKRSRALLLHTGVVGIILLVNFALTLWGVKHYAYLHGVATIYQGSCAFVKRLDLWLHLLINLLSTGMLMASNYCMQLQAAPTRRNLDKAHEAEDWLDIGVPSLRNLRYIGNWRRFSWLLLALSSLPVHLMYVNLRR